MIYLSFLSKLQSPRETANNAITALQKTLQPTGQLNRDAFQRTGYTKTVRFNVHHLLLSMSTCIVRIRLCKDLAAMLSAKCSSVELDVQGRRKDLEGDGARMGGTIPLLCNILELPLVRVTSPMRYNFFCFLRYFPPFHGHLSEAELRSQQPLRFLL